jgi:hypothetical protein
MLLTLDQSRRTLSARSVLLEPQRWSAPERSAVEARFFKGICLPNGTHKTTAAARLADVDAKLDALLGDASSVHLLDVGISSGVTTLELLERLERGGRPVTGVGIDIQLYAYLDRLLGMDVLHDGRGNILQLATPWCAKGRPDPALRSVRSHLLRALIATCERVRCGRPGSRVALVTRGLLERQDFRILEHDVTQPIDLPPGSFDVIRAANILNRSYFPAKVIERIVSNLVPLLKEDGLLLVCRTDGRDGSNHATIFRKQAAPGRRLHPVARIGNGSEIEAILA